MEITSQIRETLINKRKELGLILTDVSNKSGKTKSGKPALSVSTLSAIERGKLTGLKEETFRLLADILKLDVRGWMADQRIIKVAFGNCCWASPLINAVVKDTEKKDEPLQLQNLWLSCYADNQGEPVFLKTYNQSPEEEQQIFTGIETLSLLQNDKVDVAFLPVLTTERAAGIIRIARCMNTGKGGVYLFIIGKKGINNMKADLELDFSSSDNYDYEALKRIKNSLEGKALNESCCFVFPQNSIAQIEIVDKLFGKTAFPKYELEITSNVKFENDIKDRIDKFFKENEKAKYFVYAGWDYHIDKLKKIFKNNSYNLTNTDLTVVGKEFDGYKFTKYGYPFAMMSYDCVTLESKYDYLLKHPGLFKLLSLLSESVIVLNNSKPNINNPRYRLINQFLKMEQETTDTVLKRINWEFLIYPEMFDKNLK